MDTVHLRTVIKQRKFMCNPPEKKEYKPTKYAWFFSVIIASGVGSGLIDGFKFIWNKATRDDFRIELVDIWCRDESCTITIRNSGDESGVMTALHIDDEPQLQEQFKTTHPVGYANLKPTEGFKTSSVAFLPPKSVIDVSFGVPKNYFPKNKICFYGRKNKWCNTAQDLNKKEFKEL
ncbi:hypothetical protein ACSTLM_04585 [Vibrio parahaemolyticus]